MIVFTDTPDYLSPSTSIVVQDKLGAENTGCYNVDSACAGWVMALDLGARYLVTEPGAKYVLEPGKAAISEELIAYLKDHLAGSLHPRLSRSWMNYRHTGWVKYCNEK